MYSTPFATGPGRAQWQGAIQPSASATSRVAPARCAWRRGPIRSAVERQYSRCQLWTRGRAVAKLGSGQDRLSARQAPTMTASPSIRAESGPIRPVRNAIRARSTAARQRARRSPWTSACSTAASRTSRGASSSPVAIRAIPSDASKSSRRGSDSTRAAVARSNRFVAAAMSPRPARVHRRARDGAPHALPARRRARPPDRPLGGSERPARGGSR